MNTTLEHLLCIKHARQVRCQQSMQSATQHSKAQNAAKHRRPHQYAGWKALISSGMFS